MFDEPSNVLAGRYASDQMRAIWSPARRVVLERRLWLAVLKAQQQLGVDVPEQVVQAYENVADQVDLQSIAQRERTTRHDVKARIDEFCELAGYQHIHKGMTSRDLTENVEQMQIRESLALVRQRAVAALIRFGRRAAEFADMPMTGRSHNVAAQVTTLGKRFANAAEELLTGVEHLEQLLERYPLRGIKGPVGTQQDMLELLDNDRENLRELEQRIARHLGFARVLGAVGQVYPRSLDLEVVATLLQLAAGPCSFAKTLRLMAGQGLISEGFQPGQVGSSAMPHKVNARTCERIGGLGHVLAGHVGMLAGISGDQWNEGDVSCSVVRRVAIADAFFAMDGLLQNLLHVLDELSVFPAQIRRELEDNLPFLATSKVLIACVQRGLGRETAHALIKEHALAAARALRETGRDELGLLARLANDPRIPLDLDELGGLLSQPIDFVGTAVDQARALARTVEQLALKEPDAAVYVPAPLL